MKQPINPKMAAGILLLVALVIGFFWWRSASQPRAETATGSAGTHRHIKPGSPWVYSNSNSAATSGSNP
jgi:hypothetical protein